MADSKYIQLNLNGEVYDLPQTNNIPVAIDYLFENSDDFRQKRSSVALGLVLPATTKNGDQLNTLTNPNSEDFTTNKDFSSPMTAVLVANGNELLNGKGIITNAKHNQRPISYLIDMHGDNADWLIDNAELTLIDCVNQNTHYFTKANIEASWAFDGTSETLDYVYAPVRYRKPFGSDGSNNVINPLDLRPAISKYWILYRGFKRLGYKIQSTFLDSQFYRRQTIPWTWGNFLNIDGKQSQILKAKGIGIKSPGSSHSLNDGFIFDKSGLLAHVGTGTMIPTDSTTNLKVSNDYMNGGYDNYQSSDPAGDGTYTWVGGSKMQWKYPVTPLARFGVITGVFTVAIPYHAQMSQGSSMKVNVNWYINNIIQPGLKDNAVVNISVSGASQILDGTETLDKTISGINPGDTIAAELEVEWDKNILTDDFRLWLSTDWQMSGDPLTHPTFEVTDISIDVGGVVDLKSYEKFRNYLWVDLLRGEIDNYDLMINTDVASKTVFIEPRHSYSITASLGTKVNGWFNGKKLDWTSKQDFSKESTIDIFSDYEQLIQMKLKDDGADGLLKMVQDRFQVNLTECDYQLPSRFKKGIKAFENRFFSGVIHCDQPQFAYITGIAPQFICLVPENVSNTSESESESTFNPKSAYYKGLCDKNTYGGWNWDGDTSKDLPYMFAVNYKPGGENDPILTYNDQNIRGVLGYGLFKRFFLQNFAIKRHGKLYTTWFNLNDTDVQNINHCEFKIVGQSLYELAEINGYKPLMNETTMCKLWRWYPVMQEDIDNTFPSSSSVLSATKINSKDLIYQPLKCLVNDLPQ